MFYCSWYEIVWERSHGCFTKQVGCNNWNLDLSYNLKYCAIFPQCGHSLTLFKTLINIPALCEDAFCEDSLVWQLFPAFKKKSVGVQSKPSTTVLCSLPFYCRKKWRWFQGSSFCACSKLQSLRVWRLGDPGRYLGEGTVQDRLLLLCRPYPDLKVVTVSFKPLPFS